MVTAFDPGNRKGPESPTEGLWLPAEVPRSLPEVLGFPAKVLGFPTEVLWVPFLGCRRGALCAPCSPERTQ